VRTASQRFGKAWHRGAVFAAATLVLADGLVRGQDTPAQADDTKARVEQLESEVRTLQSMLNGGAVTPAGGQSPGPPPADKPAAAGDAPKASDAAKPPETFLVGDDVKFITTWDAGGFRFKTADEAFSAHIGGRLMTDEAWWTQ